MAPGLFIDGRAAASLPLPDRGLAYGDGLFETLLVRGRQPAWPALHGERLSAGLARLGIPEPPWRDHLASSLAAVDAPAVGTRPTRPQRDRAPSATVPPAQ